MNHKETARLNENAWSASAYQAWVNRYGIAKEAAASIGADPEAPLRRLLSFIDNPAGKRIANPLGSHGRVATALALLGAEVTVFDISESNARYARELADAAGVSLDYIIGDFQETASEYRDKFDNVVMDLGVVHYFVDLDAFAASTRSLLKHGGKLVLSEFHPLLKKSFDVDAGGPTFKGDYFRSEIEDAPTPYEVFVEEDVPCSSIRRWNLGEITTAFASSRFRIENLIEHPSTEFRQLPGTFTLVATAD